MRRRVAITFVLCATVCLLLVAEAARRRTLQALRARLAAAVRADRRPARSLGRNAGHGQPPRRAPALARTRARGLCWRWRAGRARLPRPTSSTGPSPSGRRSKTATSWCSTSAERASPACCAAGACSCRSPARRWSRHKPPSGVRSRSAHAVPTTRPGIRSMTSMPCGAPSAWTRSPCSASRTGPRSRSGMPPGTRSTWSACCSTRSSSRPDQGPSPRRASPRCRASSAPCARGVARRSRRTCPEISRRCCPRCAGDCCTGRWSPRTAGASAPGSAGCGSWSCCSPETSTPLCAPSCPLP